MVSGGKTPKHALYSRAAPSRPGRADQMREELEPRSVPLDDRLGVEPRRQRPERAEAVAGAERLGDACVAVPVEGRSLQRDRHRLDEAARALLGRVSEHRLHMRRVARLELAQERLGRRRLAAQRAEDVECLHVRGALPDRVQRALAEEAREAALLDEAVPAEAFERLADDGRGPLADPVLEDCGRDPAEAVVTLVEGAREPQR